MISEAELKQVLDSLLGHAVPRKLNIESIAQQLSVMEQTKNTALSAYGYAMYALEHAGLSGIYHGRLADPTLMEGYASDARKYKEDMPTLLVNASKYADKVYSQILDPDLCMPRLAGMSFPYVLFVLFAGTGHPEMVYQFKDETQEVLDRYPDTLALLPENFITATKEALANADIQ